MNCLLIEPEELESTDGRVRITGRRRRHAEEILRTSVGDSLRVGVIGGQLGTARVLELDEDALEKLGWGDAFTPGFQVRMLWPEIAAYLNPQVRDYLEQRYPSLKGRSTGTGEQ